MRFLLIYCLLHLGRIICTVCMPCEKYHTSNVISCKTHCISLSNFHIHKASAIHNLPLTAELNQAHKTQVHDRTPHSWWSPRWWWWIDFELICVELCTQLHRGVHPKSRELGALVIFWRARALVHGHYLLHGTAHMLEPYISHRYADCADFQCHFPTI